MTTLGPKRGPFWKRAPRRRNSFVDLVGATRAHVGEMLAVDRRAHFKRALRLDAFTVNEMSGRDMDPRYFCSCHCSSPPTFMLSIILPLTSAPIPTPAEGSWSAWLDSFR